MLRNLMYIGVFLSAGLGYAVPLSQVPQTGQTSTTPSNAPAGSDGALQKGIAWPSPHFVLTPDGSGDCITDNLTGLTWQRNPSSTKYTWANAILTDANSGGALPTTLCGFNDWRLPNQNELRSLVNYGYTDNSTSSQSAWLTSQGFTNVSADIYWSSSTYAQNNGKAAWYINMGVSEEYNQNKTNLGYVWPVRGGQ